MANLIDLLKNKKESGSLPNDILKIRKFAEPFLAKIIETFPEYTIHDIRHSERTLDILSWLIPPDLIERMNAHELFFLIASSYLHDIGMVNFPELLDIELSGLENDEQIRTHIRMHHHTRSEKIVILYYSKLGIEDEFQARIIGRICRGHRENLDDKRKYNNREMYTTKNIPINVPILASFLQIADDLDISFERTPIQIFETIKPKDTLSLQEWERHLSTCGLGLDPENAARIIVSAKCWNPNVHRSLKKYEIRIQDKLDVLSDHLYQYRDCMEKLPQRIIVIIETIGYEAIDFRFRLQEKDITRLLMGERLYDRKEAVLRELLQNAYDACRLRTLREPDIEPKISFQLSSDKRKLIVQDNGIGMNRNQIEKYFTRIGRCFYQSSEFLEEKTDFSPVSLFGIGILSIFMISDHIVINTKTKTNLPLIIEIFSIEDYFLVRPGTLTETGTNVTIFLKDDFGLNLNLEKEVSFYAYKLDFPIKIIDSDQTDKFIIPEKRMPRIHYFLSRRVEETKNTIEAEKRYGFKIYEINTPNFDATFGLICKKDNHDKLSPITRFSYWINANNRIFVSKEGIFVNEIPNLIPSYFEKGIFLDINLRGNIVNLNLSRTDIVNDEKRKDLSTILEKIILDNLKAWINITEKEHGLSIEFRDAIHNIYLNESILFRTRYNQMSQNIRDYYRDVYYFHIYSEKTEHFMTFNDILKTKKQVTILDDIPQLDSARKNSMIYVMDLLKHCVLDGTQLYYPQVYLNQKYWSICYINDLSINIQSFYSLFDIEAVHNPIISMIFPGIWRVVRFNNLITKRMFEIFGPSWDNKTRINADHPFISLLLKNQEALRKNQTLLNAIKNFFSGLKHDLKFNPNTVLEKQVRILEWLNDLGVENNIEKMVLKKKDIPHIYH